MHDLQSVQEMFVTCVEINVHLIATSGEPRTERFTLTSAIPRSIPKPPKGRSSPVLTAAANRQLIAPPPPLGQNFNAVYADVSRDKGLLGNSLAENARAKVQPTLAPMQSCSGALELPRLRANKGDHSPQNLFPLRSRRKTNEKQRKQRENKGPGININVETAFSPSGIANRSPRVKWRS
jgi:hypothetical protein